MNENQFAILSYELIQTNESLRKLLYHALDPANKVTIEDLQIVSARIERLRKLRISAGKAKRM